MKEKFVCFSGEFAPVAMNRCIYFVQSDGTDRPIKIGYTENITKRFAGLDGTVPDTLTLLAIIPSGSRDQEKQLHKYFENHRKKGEWFYPCRELIAYIDQINHDLDAGIRVKIPKLEESTEKLSATQQAMRDFDLSREERRRQKVRRRGGLTVE